MTEFRQDLGMGVLSMDRKSSPCKDCPDRKIGCHGRCEAYQSWRLGVDGVIQEKIYFSLSMLGAQEESRRPMSDSGTGLIGGKNKKSPLMRGMVICR